ncbi:indole-3-acetic acid-amido synthetase GH3.6 [Tanacetum coccineum]
MPEAPPPTLTERNKKSLEFIEDVTSNPDEVQLKVLSGILTQNADVEYLRRHGFHGQTDRETFKKLVPVITYEDLQPDINRIANGDKSPILSSHPISEFLTSSGTSGGERKLMPTIEAELGRRSMLYSLLMPVMSQFVPGLDKGRLVIFRSLNPWPCPADPELADFIERECSKKSWQGIITRLWPNTKYVDVIVTGTMSQYIPTLDYYSNGLPLVCTMYASSIAILCHLNPALQDYELWSSTYAGLYSIDSDKTDEVELHQAIEKACNHLVPFDTTLNEYTSFADTTTIPGHYVIFWELSANGSTNIPPSGRASDKSIGPLEIRIVDNGTFDKLMDYAISLGASINQYKTPRRGLAFTWIVRVVMSRDGNKTSTRWGPDPQTRIDWGIPELTGDGDGDGDGESRIMKTGCEKFPNPRGGPRSPLGMGMGNAIDSRWWMGTGMGMRLRNGDEDGKYDPRNSPTHCHP